MANNVTLDFMSFNGSLETINGGEEIFVNATEDEIPWLYNLNQDDTSWIMTSSFIIFTMQTGK